MSTLDRITELVGPLLAPLHTELIDVELVGPVLRLTIDRKGGLDMQAITEVTRAVSRALDEHDPLFGTYTLEVTSPGLERRLRRPDHFMRAVGGQVTVKTVPGSGGDRRLDGTLLAADDDGIVIGGGDPDAERRQVRYDQIERARTVFEWGPGPKPGKKPDAASGPVPPSRPTKRKKAPRS